MSLAEHKDHIYSCLRCAFCFDLRAAGQHLICPPHRAYGFESFGARGKVAIARALIDGEVDPSPGLARRVFACTECGACEAQCFKYLPLRHLFRALKTDLASQRLLPDGIKGIASGLREAGNPYGKPPESRHAWVPGTSRVGKRASVLLFSGCTPSYLRRGIVRATYRVLEALGVEFALLEDERCCGHAYLSFGMEAEAREAAEANVAEIVATGAETVVLPCPGCLRAFRDDVPRLLKRPVPFRALHVTELVARELGRRVVPLQRQSRIVTYHDPCNLGRGLGVYDSPRWVIGSIPGIRLVEMARSGKTAFCCGHGGFVRADHPDVAVESAASRWTEAVATGADTVLSTCPACETAFLGARLTAGSAAEVMDVVELLAQVV